MVWEGGCNDPMLTKPVALLVDPRTRHSSCNERGRAMSFNPGWVVVAVGFLATGLGMGAMFSLPVFLTPIAADTGWPRGGIATAMTLNFLSMGISAFGWGALSDRIGPRRVVLAGAVLLAIGLALASRSSSLLQFQLVYGVLVGIAGGSFMAPMVATVTLWFDRHRALAVSLVGAGLAVAPMTVSPIAAWLIEAQGWRAAQLSLAAAAAVLLIPASWLVRRPATLAVAAAAGLQRATAWPALRSRRFAVLALTFFACCAAHSGPIFHTVSYAIGCGLSAMAAVTVYSVEGLAGLSGRLLFGVLADRLGVKRVLVAGLLLQALAAGAYALVSQLGEFYAVALVFGLAYGGVMPLYAVLARAYFAPQIMGTVLGALMLASSFGMALGPAVGGWLFDRFGSYTWLYVGSLAVGLGAAAIALAFPQPRSARSRVVAQTA
jgi:MFS family permease